MYASCRSFFTARTLRALPPGSGRARLVSRPFPLLLALLCSLVFLCGAGPGIAREGAATPWQPAISDHQAVPGRLLAVDKSEQKLFLLERRSPLAQTRQFICSTGRSLGDKAVEGDLKTPEGIYFIVQHINTGLDFVKYGKEAYTLNYPNPVDRLRQKTGYGIWIHGRGEPIVPMQTEGCVAMVNEDLRDMGGILAPGMPVALTNSFSIKNGAEAAATAETAGILEKRVREWADAWASRSAVFFDFYDPQAYGIAQGEAFSRFKAQKERLFKILPWIKIEVSDIHVLEGPGYWVTWFHQDYSAPNLTSKGVRRLYWQKTGDKEFKILGMEWVPGLTTGTLLASAEPALPPLEASPRTEGQQEAPAQQSAAPAAEPLLLAAADKIPPVSSRDHVENPSMGEMPEPLLAPYILILNGSHGQVPSGDWTGKMPQAPKETEPKATPAAGQKSSSPKPRPVEEKAAEAQQAKAAQEAQAAQAAKAAQEAQAAQQAKAAQEAQAAQQAKAAQEAQAAQAAKAAQEAQAAQAAKAAQEAQAAQQAKAAQEAKAGLSKNAASGLELLGSTLDRALQAAAATPKAQPEQETAATRTVASATQAAATAPQPSPEKETPGANDAKPGGDTKQPLLSDSGIAQSAAQTTPLTPQEAQADSPAAAGRPVVERPAETAPEAAPTEPDGSPYVPRVTVSFGEHAEADEKNSATAGRDAIKTASQDQRQNQGQDRNQDLAATVLDITAHIEKWRQSWEAADLDAYAAFYAPEAVQGNRHGSRAIYRQKQNLWHRDKPGKISLNDIQVTVQGGTATVRMIQEYSGSSGHADTGYKTLELKKIDGAWRISREDWKAQPDG